jgi:hypothetical protein
MMHIRVSKMILSNFHFNISRKPKYEIIGNPGRSYARPPFEVALFNNSVYDHHFKGVFHMFDVN